MTDLGQKRTIHVKGYRWGITRSLYLLKGVKCRSGQVHVGSLLQLKMWYEQLIVILLKWSKKVIEVMKTWEAKHV